MCWGIFQFLGLAYEEGRGVTIDKKKAKHYYELAAMGGSVKSRNNLGVIEHEGCVIFTEQLNIT